MSDLLSKKNDEVMSIDEIVDWSEDIISDIYCPSAENVAFVVHELAKHVKKITDMIGAPSLETKSE